MKTYTVKYYYGRLDKWVECYRTNKYEDAKKEAQTQERLLGASYFVKIVDEFGKEIA